MGREGTISSGNGKWPAEDMPEHDGWSIYSQRLSRGRTGTVRNADADWSVLDGMLIGATWRIRLNRPCAAAMRPYVKLL